MKAVVASLGLVLGAAPSTYAASLAQQTAALDVIADEANHFCVRVPLAQSTSGYQLSGDASARISGIAKHLADLGIGGAAKYSHAASQGVLQQHLAGAIRSSNDCRLEVLRILKDTMLPLSTPAPRSRPPPRPPVASIAPISGPRLFVDCHKSSASFRAPPSGIYYELRLNRDWPDLFMATEPGEGRPGPRGNDVLRAMRCAVTNVGPVPLVDVSIPVSAVYEATKLTKASTIDTIDTIDTVSAGDAVAESRGSIHIDKIGTGDAEKFTFSVENRGKDFVKVTFGHAGSGQPIDRDGKLPVTILQPRAATRYELFPARDSSNEIEGRNSENLASTTASNLVPKADVSKTRNQRPPTGAPMFGDTPFVPESTNAILMRARTQRDAGDKLFDQLFSADTDSKIVDAVKLVEIWDRAGGDLVDDLIGRKYRSFYQTYQIPYNFYMVPELARKLSSSEVYWSRKNYLNLIRNRQAAISQLFVAAPTATSLQ